MSAIPSVTIRRARHDDVAAIVAMLADDHLGRARERLEHPLPASYREAFERLDADPNITLVVAEEAGRVVGSLQLCILPGLSSQGASRGLPPARDLQDTAVARAQDILIAEPDDRIFFHLRPVRSQRSKLHWPHSPTFAKFISRKRKRM